MSAIAGILGQVSDDNRAALARMARAMAHRGPDGEQFWFGEPDDSGNGCMLAHRRLDVTAPPPDAPHQPLRTPDGMRVIVLEGTVYNYRDVNAALDTPLPAAGPAGVALHALARQGPAALATFRGAFGLALWDEAQRELLLARDPLGVRQLYVCRNPNPDARGWTFAFASEVRAFAAAGLLTRPRLNPDAVASLVWNGQILSPATMIEHVEPLWPGEARQVDARGQTVMSRPFWSMPARAQSKRRDSDEFRDTLYDAVRLNLQSEAPLVVFLSGGVDSSTVANLAKRFNGSAGGPVHTFCLAMDEQALNEGAIAREVAAAIGSTHHEVLLTEQLFLDRLDDATAAVDQPSFDGVNQYHVCRGTREAGFRVALGGNAADAAVGCGRNFRSIPRLRAWALGTAPIPEAVRVAAANIMTVRARRPRRGFAPQTAVVKLPEFARAGADPIHLFQVIAALFLPATQRELLADPTPMDRQRFGLDPRLYDRVNAEIAGHSLLEQISIIVTRLLVGERLHKDANSVGGAVGQEVRSPFADTVWLEACNRLLEDERFRPTDHKLLLRRHGLDGLDPALFRRKKVGFVVPFDRWIREGSLGKAMNQVMRDHRMIAAAGLRGPAIESLWQAFLARAPGLYWSRVWAIYSHVRWCHRYGVLS